MGTHHLYFVASRGVTPTVDNDAKTITWATVRDTFWKHYELTVTGGTRAPQLPANAVVSRQEQYEDNLIISYRNQQAPHPTSQSPI